MIETSARLLQALSLLQLKREWTGPMLAERMGVTERTVRRDIEKLRSLGYPINASPGVAGGYQLGSGAQLPPLLLDDDEALAVALGLSSVTASPVSGVGEAAIRALTKLEQVLPSRLRPKFASLRAAVQRTRGPVTPVNPEVLTSLSTAISERRAVGFRYSRADGESARRLVEPYGLVDTGMRWYLVAWDQVRVDWRIFRADRFESVPHHRERFTPRTPPAKDLSLYVSESVTGSPYRHIAVVRFLAPAHQVVERFPPHFATIEESTDGATCTVRAGFDSLPYILGMLVSVNEDFEIVEPAPLREYAFAVSGRLSQGAKSREAARGT